MSKTKVPHAEAMEVASALLEILRPNCEAVEIAGSLRRVCQMVGDIEFVFVPRIIQEPDGFFDSKSVNMTEKLIQGWLASGVITKRLAVTGKISSWGRDNKHAVHVASGISVDFFAEHDIRDWPRSLAIRTGPKDFNIRLMVTAPKNGYNAHAYGEALHKIPSGERVFAKNEREFIELCGIKYCEPKYRL